MWAGWVTGWVGTCRWVYGLVWGLGGFVWAGWVTGWVGTCRWVCGLVCDWVNITMLMVCGLGW